MEKAKEKLMINIAELFKVKTITTLFANALLGVIIIGKIKLEPEILTLFATAYTAIVTNYFSKKDMVK